MHRTDDTLDKLIAGATPDTDELAALIEALDEAGRARLYVAAASRREATFGRRVYFRGLIEFTSYCAQNCLYCGLRRDNTTAARYRLTAEQILDCCGVGHALGYRSFVLQGGEDAYFDDDRMTVLVSAIRQAHPDCAITLSIGERSRASYERLFRAGANRYLLRHETADAAHYARLHAPGQALSSRLRALRDLMEIGYQTGAGFMVGSPGQTARHLATDLLFLHTFRPHMVGIGPFIPHHRTPFAGCPAGSLQRTTDMLAMTRLLVPNVMLPATTALASRAPDGRARALRAGANVVMPNLSPADVRASYSIYDGKKSTGSEAAESLENMQAELVALGYEPDMSRGDWCDAPAPAEGAHAAEASE